MNVARLKKITEAADPVRSVQARRMGPEDTVGGWGYFRRNFLRYFRQLRKVAPSEWASVRTPFAIFGSGNGKLPFKTFSTTPGADCPGAGECWWVGKKKGWCYSVKAWRYPAAFFGQLMRSVLMRSPETRAIIAHEFGKLGPNAILRLYVDGDFRDVEQLEFWMNLLKTRPDIRAYGYSKSWDEFLLLDSRGYDWPDNYQLNLSSGSRHPHYMRELMARLACARGEFVAVKDADKNNPVEIMAAVRRLTGQTKVVACPGLCGECGAREHHCANKALGGVPIGIGIH